MLKQTKENFEVKNMGQYLNRYSLHVNNRLALELGNKERILSWARLFWRRKREGRSMSSVFPDMPEKPIEEVYVLDSAIDKVIYDNGKIGFFDI